MNSPMVEHSELQSQSIQNRSSCNIEHAHWIFGVVFFVQCVFYESTHVRHRFFVAMYVLSVDFEGGIGP